MTIVPPTVAMAWLCAVAWLAIALAWWRVAGVGDATMMMPDNDHEEKEKNEDEWKKTNNNTMIIQYEEKWKYDTMMTVKEIPVNDKWRSIEDMKALTMLLEKRDMWKYREII